MAIALGPAPTIITATQYEELPETHDHIEVVDGVVHVSPRPTLAHQAIVAGLLVAVRAVCPPELLCVTEVDVRLSDVPPNIRVPDVLVVRHGKRPGVLRPDRVLLAVEVVSPTSVTVDRLHKPQEYAMAGIPNYWLVEDDSAGLTLTAGRLDEAQRRYRLGPRLTGNIELDEPFPVSVDLGAISR